MERHVVQIPWKKFEGGLFGAVCGVCLWLESDVGLANQEHCALLCRIFQNEVLIGIVSLPPLQVLVNWWYVLLQHHLSHRAPYA